MKYCMCSIRDIAANVFAAPFFAASTATAIRDFSNAVNDDRPTNLNMHPADFELYFIGHFDDAHATFDLAANPVQLTTAKQVLKPRPQLALPVS